MSKQTIWLITMLSLMVVLSAYYIVSGPVEPADEVAMSDETEVNTIESNPLELTLFGAEEKEEEEEGNETEEDPMSAEDSEDEKEGDAEQADSEETDAADSSAFGSDDFFLSMQIERSSINEQLLSKYESVMTDPDASEEQTAAAGANMEQLRSSIEQITLMEELIRGQGYSDALVRQEGGRYDITVQADEMSRAEAVKILQAVQDETDVPATYLSISYHP